MADSAKANGRLEQQGWRPAEEAPCPCPPSFLRQGESRYTTGERTEEGNWIMASPFGEAIPVNPAPTHYKPFPD